MNLEQKIGKVARRGLYRNKQNLIHIGITHKGEHSYYTFGSLPGDYDINTAIFEIGSITKTFTSILLADLVRDQIVSLDDPIIKFRPQYENSTTLNGKPMTLRHLTTHTAGLPREDKALIKSVRQKKSDKLNPYENYSKDDLDTFFKTYHLSKAEKFHYSNLGLALLADILEDVLGMPYVDAMYDRVCKPLGLHDTVFTLDEEQQTRQVLAYTKKDQLIPSLTVDGMVGAGGLSSSMQDMIRFLEMNMGQIDHPLEVVLASTHQKQTVISKNKMEMGLGWLIEYNKKLNHPMIRTAGATVGFHSYAGFIKEEQLGIVVLSTYHLNLLELIFVLLGKGPIISDRVANMIFAKFKSTSRS